jgi:hypothetical protein
VHCEIEVPLMIQVARPFVERAWSPHAVGHPRGSVRSGRSAWPDTAGPADARSGGSGAVMRALVAFRQGANGYPRSA